MRKCRQRKRQTIARDRQRERRRREVRQRRGHGKTAEKAEWEKITVIPKR